MAAQSCTHIAWQGRRHHVQGMKMNDYWVVVTDGGKARFMVLEERAGASSRGKFKLVEAARLLNPDHTVTGRRDTRKIRSGRDTARGSLAPHGYTDKRNPHETELLRRFASRIAGQAATLVANNQRASIVMVADPRMLGLLRTALLPVKKAGVQLNELRHDYTWCTAPQLCRHLAENDLLPA
jgi:protein required for attachment to host cells